MWFSTKCVSDLQSIRPLSAELFSGTYLHFESFPHIEDDAGTWNPSIWKTKACSSLLANTTATGDLAILEDRTSEATVLT